MEELRRATCAFAHLHKIRRVFLLSDRCWSTHACYVHCRSCTSPCPLSAWPLYGTRGVQIVLVSLRSYLDSLNPCTCLSCFTKTLSRRMSSAGVRGNTHSLAEDTLLHNVKAFIDPKGRERHICKAVLSLGPRHHPGVLGGEGERPAQDAASASHSGCLFN